MSWGGRKDIAIGFCRGNSLYDEGKEIKGKGVQDRDENECMIKWD